MNEEQLLAGFTSVVQAQREAALIIATADGQALTALKHFTGKGYSHTDNAIEAMTIIEASSIVMQLTSPLPKNTYDFIRQYTDRGGMIQLMDTKTMNYMTTNFDPHTSHLVLIVTEDNLMAIEQVFSIRNNVGPVERI